MEQFPEEQFMIITDHDNAIIGFDVKTMVLVYSVNQILKNLQQHMTKDEAIEFFDYNISEAYVGEKTPLFIYDTN